MTGKPTPLRLSFTIHGRASAAFSSFLRGHLRAAHAILRPPLGELSVALVGDGRMAELHEQFMGIPGPTDVLTFPLEADARGNVTAGEVVVCVPEARRRAKEHGVGVERELLLYALHGMLHLCGYDDKTAAAFRTMHRTEDRILTQLGVGPVFKPGHARSPAPPKNRPAKRTGRRATRATGAH